MNIGSYKILSVLSEGSFGRTYRAEHCLLKTTVCVKEEIAFHATGDARYQEWFKEEAKLLFDIHHPLLPNCKDYFELPNDQNTYDQLMVMSFVPGDSLDKIINKNGFIDDEHICWILMRCLDALAYLHHKKKIIHCDIKPQNIILNTKDHDAFIIDLGLCSVAPMAQTKPKGGSEFFMPPEFELGRPPLPAADIYSLGKVAIYLSGGNPATGVNNLIPPLNELISKMIRQDPLARPQSVIEINEEIIEIRKKVWGRLSTLEEIKFK